MSKFITITTESGLRYIAEMGNFLHYKLLNVMSEFELEVIGNVLAKFFHDSIDKHGSDAVLTYMGDTFKGEHAMQRHEVINSLLGIATSLLADYVNDGGEMKLIGDAANGVVSLLMSFLAAPTTPAVPAATAATPPPAA